MKEAMKPEGSMWSDDQWRAIALHGDDILVAAAAGSGKTAVLVERIIRKITDEAQGFSIDRLLVATFTKAAAAEMRQRIREALDQELSKYPDNEHLRRQLSLLGKASITTLHSFCLDVIRRYYQLIPLDPGFRIMNENDAELLRQETLEELFEEKYGEAAEGSSFLRFVDWFSGERTDDAVYVLVQKLYDFARSHSWPDRWLRQMAAAFRVANVSELGQSQWAQSILQDAKLAMAGAQGLLEQAISISLAPGGPAPYVDNLRADLEMVTSLMEALEDFPWEALHSAFDTVTFGKLKSCRKDQTDPELQERVKELRDSVKKTISELKNSLFGRSAEEFLSELHESAPLMEELAEVVIMFGERYQQEKRRRVMVDFSDLEHYCLQILRHPDSPEGDPIPSDAALEYQSQFDEVLLDEYQDTNSVQEDIVKLISRANPGNRFMVGDVKQSIYRFRLAEPGLFLDKYRTFSTETMSNGVRIDLARNFRSRMEVVDAVNMIFRQLMNESVAEISYDERAELVYGASFPENQDDQNEGYSRMNYHPELILIDRGRGSHYEEETPSEEEPGLAQENDRLEMETAQLEARVIARRIKEMMGENGEQRLLVYDKGLKTMRPVQYGDMVILLRSAYIWGPLIMDELREQGISADADQKQGFFQATEIEIMLSLLQVIDNPRQDIPFAGVLRSPIVGLTEEELAQVRLCHKGTFYEAVLAAAGVVSETETQSMESSLGAVEGQYPQSTEVSGSFLDEIATAVDGRDAIPSEESGDLTSVDNISEISSQIREKLQGFLSHLASWRDEARQGNLGELIWRIYRETGYMDWLGGLPGGRDRQVNLTALYDRAVQFEQSTTSRGLFRFLTFIARLRDHGSDQGSTGTSDSPDNAVRIMTIHKSKGLEFPVVFLAGVGKSFNQQDLNKPFLMHKELGFGPRYVDEALRVSYPTMASLAIRRRSQLELLAEEMRVLYVALTRPKEKLIVIGTVKELIKKAASWSQVQYLEEQLLPDYVLARGRSYLDWIGPSLIRHPGAAVLRELGGAGTASSSVLTDDASLWEVQLASADELSQELHLQSADENVMTPEREMRLRALAKYEPVDEQDEAQLESDSMFLLSVETGKSPIERLEWEYLYQLAGTLSAKTTVTEMKRMLALQDQPSTDLIEEASLRREMLNKGGSSYTLQLRRPKFMEEQALSPTERGTAYHVLMQHIPLSQGLVSVEVVEATLRRLIEQEMLTSHQGDAIDVTQVAAMYETELGQRLLSSEKVWRELPFSFGIPAADAHRDLPLASHVEELTDSSVLAQETVLIQGIVDCLFRDPERGHLILLDYKTDKVLAHLGGTAALTEQYRFQLELYGRAIEHILGEPVMEKWLYFFDGSHLVEI